MREAVGLDPAEREVHVGDGELTARSALRGQPATRAAVAERTGVGASALGAHGQTKAVEAAQRAPARRHGVDAQHRCLDPHPAHLGLEAALDLAEQIAANSPLAVQGSKAVINAAKRSEVSRNLDHVALWNAAFLYSDDLAEAISSFIEKRPPEYKGQ